MMVKNTFNFELGNRDLFPSEHAAVNKAKHALIASAARHGKTIPASALFRGPAKVDLAGRGQRVTSAEQCASLPDA